MHHAQDRIWWIEHQIRALTEGRGMRPGRAIRRVLGTEDDATHNLARLWDGEQFAVTFGADEALFEAAYREVRSCMQGHGEMCHRAYAPHGVGLAVITLKGKIQARCLYREQAFPQAYGEMSYALECFLVHVAGMRSDQSWIAAAAPKCRVTQSVVESIWTVTRERFVGNYILRADAHEACSTVKTGPGESVEIVPQMRGYGWGYRVLVKRTRFIKKYTEKVIFTPYIDGIGRIA